MRITLIANSNHKNARIIVRRVCLFACMSSVFLFHSLSPFPVLSHFTPHLCTSLNISRSNQYDIAQTCMTFQIFKLILKLKRM